MTLGLCILVGTGCETLSSDLSLMMEELMPPSPGEAARWMFDESNADQRRRGVTLIANSPFGGGESYIRTYEDKVQFDEDPLVRAAAVRALGRYGEPDHAPLLARQLLDESEQVRWEAAMALQRLHNPLVIGPLIDTLSNEGELVDVRAAAATALGQYSQDRVFQRLVTALDARELSLNLAALDSLRTMTGQRFGPDLRTWVRWYTETSDPFAGGEEYRYPTYSRRITLFERLTFWSTKTWEQPAPPAGLRHADERQTYDN